MAISANKKAYNRAYYLANREKAKQRNRAYYLANQEVIKHNVRVYRKANPEKVNICNRKYEAGHPDKVKKWRRNYFERNIDSLRAKSMAYYKTHREKERERKRAAYAKNPQLFCANRRDRRMKNIFKARAIERRNTRLYRIRNAARVKKLEQVHYMRRKIALMLGLHIRDVSNDLRLWNDLAIVAINLSEASKAMKERLSKCQLNPSRSQSC